MLLCAPRQPQLAHLFRFAGRRIRKPFNPQSLISHLTNSNGCGILCPKVLLTVSPFRPFLQQQPSLFLSSPKSLTALLIYSCKLFVAARKVNLFAIKQIRTLSPKHPGWGVPATSPRLKSATYKLLGSGPVCKPVTPERDPARPRFLAPLSSLECEFTPTYALTPLSTAFTQNDRVGRVS